MIYRNAGADKNTPPRFNDGENIIDWLLTNHSVTVHADFTSTHDANTELWSKYTTQSKKKKKSTHKRCNIAGIWAASDSSIRTAQYPLTNTNGWIRSDCMSCSDVRCCAPLTCQQQLHVKRQKWGGGGDIPTKPGGWTVSPKGGTRTA